MTRVLVTGDRHCHCKAFAWRAVARMAARYGPGLVIVHGDARGVDAAFRDACEALGVDQERHPADWATGKGAGPRRNAEMVAAGADFCPAVHADLGHSRGTGDCVRRCPAAGIPVWHVDPGGGGRDAATAEGGTVSESIARIVAAIDAAEAEVGHDEAGVAARRRLLGGMREAIRRHGCAAGECEGREEIAAVPVGLFGKPIREVAAILLAETRGWVAADELAGMALARGYRSHKSRDDPVKIARSFYETMRRHPDRFEQDVRDRRRFRLAAHRETGAT